MNKIFKMYFLLILFSFIFLPYSVNAISVYNWGATLGLGTSDLQQVVVEIIQWILGLLGLIGVIMVLYGGFTWMTAAGNEEKIQKAKGIITAGIIGLVIIILAWAIVIFAINVLTNSTS